MAAKKKNAFAELAKQIKGVGNALAFYRGEYSPVLDKAQRIVAELAKVTFFNDGIGAPCARAYESMLAVNECRVIAEEGVEDGK